MGFLKFTARVLIITALISSAYHHLNNPNEAIQEFNVNYKVLDEISNQYFSYDIPYDNVSLLLLRLIGAPLFEFSDFSKP